MFLSAMLSPVYLYSDVKKQTVNAQASFGLLSKDHGQKDAAWAERMIASSALASNASRPPAAYVKGSLSVQSQRSMPGKVAQTEGGSGEGRADSPRKEYDHVGAPAGGAKMKNVIGAGGPGVGEIKAVGLGRSKGLSEGVRHSLGGESGKSTRLYDSTKPGNPHNYIPPEGRVTLVS